MSNIKLDLSKFKHVKSDDNSTTLQHYEGHTLTLAHKKLSKANQEQLKALGAMSKNSKKPSDKAEAIQDNQARGPQAYAQGGDVALNDKSLLEKTMDYVDKMGDNNDKQNQVAPNAKDRQAPGQNKDKVHQMGFDQYAEGGEVADMDADSPAEAKDAPAETPIQQAMEFDPNKQTTVPDPAQRVEQLAKMYKGMNPIMSDANAKEQALETVDQEQTKAQDTSDEIKADKQAEAAKVAEQQSHIGQLQQAVGIQPPQQSAMQPQVQQAAEQQAPQQPTPAQNGIPGANDMEGMMNQGYQSKLQGINQAATAQGDLGKQQAELLNKVATAQQDASLAFKKNYDMLEAERQAHMADIKAGYIDPNKYWTGDANGNGSHSKIAAGIGMILAGFNPTTNPNAAVDFLKHQMDANLKAQQTNLDSKQNLLSANLRQFGNLKDATEMTRLMQHDILSNQLQSAAATAQNPMAKAAALQASGQLQMEAAPMFQQFAMRRAMMNLANDPNGPKDGAIQQMIAYKHAMGDHEGAKELESHYVPGVGYSPSAVIPDGVRQQLVSHQKLQNAGQDLMQYSQTHNNLIPGTPEYTAGVTKAMAFQQMVREGLLGTVFRESEKPLLEKFVKENPAGAFKAFSTQPQLKSILQSNMMANNTLKQSYGLPVRQQEQAQQNQPVKGSDGKMYIRQGKYMVPYK